MEVGQDSLRHLKTDWKGAQLPEVFNHVDLLVVALIVYKNANITADFRKIIIIISTRFIVL